MDRPILNPSIFDDPDRFPDAPTERRNFLGATGRLARRLLITVPFAVMRCTLRVLLIRLDPFSRRQVDADAAIERPTLVGRFLAPVIFRLMFLTLVVLGTVVGIVHVMTHRVVSVAASVADGPVAPGLLTEPVRLQAADGAIVKAWHVHALDETQVLRHKETAARAKWPAVVLVADQRGDGHELDRLIRPLHDRGYVVLSLQLRGASGETAQTFGLLEQQDVAAAVANLRGRQYVDRSRISVIASGTGASAALLARKVDGGISRVIAYNALASFDDVLASEVNAAWLRPACRWVFEVTHQVDTEELSRRGLASGLGDAAVVLNGSPTRPSQVETIVAMLQPNPVLTAKVAE